MIYLEFANGSFYVVILISLLLILCHVYFSDKKIVSLFNMQNNAFLNANSNTKNGKPNKIVVFDLDETLGNFVEVSMFWDALENFYGSNLFNETFYDVLETFPEFLRPNIINILEYLKDKKKANSCDQIMIYTNNQGPKTWVHMISNYFNDRIGYPVFDKVIAAFKVGGKIVEFNRTSHNKSVDDLIKCTQIHPNTEICFLDDQYHPLMNHDNVYYINVKPYFYSLPYKTMAERYYDSHQIKNTTKEDFIKAIVTNMSKYNFTVIPKNDLELEVDKVISKQIIFHLEKFFKKGRSQNTRKKRNLKIQNTRKKL